MSFNDSVLELDVEGSMPLPASADCVAASASKRRRRTWDSQFLSAALDAPDDLLCGPKDASEAVHWASADVNALKINGDKHFGPLGLNVTDALNSTLQSGVALTTDYSGLGGAEEALRHIVVAAGHGKVVVQRAGDLLPEARCVLRHHSEPCAPKCVLGDIRHRLDDVTMTRLEIRHANLKTGAVQQLLKGKARKEVLEEYGREFMRQAADMVRPKDPAGLAETLVARCYVHQRDCRVLPSVPTDFHGIRGNVAGVNCYDWSTMGKMERWLGRGVFAFVVWLRERYAAGEHFIVVECVMNFDHEMLEELFDGEFKLSVLVISPTLFGDPVERRRKYMILLAEDKLKWHPAVENMGIQESFDKLFKRSMVMKGCDRLRAPQEQVAKDIRRRACDRGLPATQASGRPWSAWMACTPAQRKAIDSHEQALQREGLDDKGSYVTNTMQNPCFIGPQELVPALLRRTHLWSFKARRYALPFELLECQGYNVYDEDIYKSDILAQLETRSDSCVKRLVGNAMHLRAVGTTLMFIFACTIPVPASN